MSGAKGRNVFVPSAATSSSQMIDDVLDISEGEAEDLPDAIKAARNIEVGGNGKVDGGDGKAGKTGDSGVGNVDDKIGHGNKGPDDPMDVDFNRGQIGTSISSSSKRKHSLDTGTPSVALSNATSVPSTSLASSEPASKKRNSSKGKGKQSAVKSSSSSAGYKVSAARTAKISNTTILHGMQGTMNRVTDIFEKSVSQPTDPHSAARDEALDLLQTREDGLSLDNQRKVVNLFMKDVVVAQTYIRLVTEDLRQSWLMEILEAE